MKIILEGIVGSIAYGLSTEDSDEDKRGIFVTPTKQILGLNPGPDVVDRNNPDVTYFEIGKFIRLGLKANPNIIEMLYLTDYTVLTPEGQLLIDNRQKFLSRVVYNSYAGYAVSQAHKLNARAYSPLGQHKRYAKHSRHCFRLLKQGRELLESGTLTVKVSNRDELFEIGQLPVDEVVTRFEEEFKKFKEIEGVLPKEPDYDGVNEMLLQIREQNYERK